MPRLALVALLLATTSAHAGEQAKAALPQAQKLAAVRERQLRRAGMPASIVAVPGRMLARLAPHLENPRELVAAGGRGVYVFLNGPNGLNEHTLEMTRGGLFKQDGQVLAVRRGVVTVQDQGPTWRLRELVRLTEPTWVGHVKVPAASLVVHVTRDGVSSAFAVGPAGERLRLDPIATRALLSAR